MSLSSVLLRQSWALVLVLASRLSIAAIALSQAMIRFESWALTHYAAACGATPSPATEDRLTDRARASSLSPVQAAAAERLAALLSGLAWNREHRDTVPMPASVLGCHASLFEAFGLFALALKEPPPQASSRDTITVKLVGHHDMARMLKVLDALEEFITQFGQGSSPDGRP